MRHWRIAVGAGLLLLFGCDKQPEADLTDDTAQALMEGTWNEQALAVPVGELTVVAGADDPTKRQISEQTYNNDLALARAGFISVTVHQDLTSSFQGWNNWFALTTQGVRKRISIAGTTDGISATSAATLSVPKDPGTLYFQAEAFSITQIIENSEVKTKIDTFHVVKGTATRTCTPYGARINAAGWAVCVPGAAHFVVLFKFDPFGKRWQLAAIDWAMEPGDFTTHAVQDYLSHA